jgi:hypothetical protein
MTIEDKINNITTPSQSQLDREAIKQKAFGNLMGFLNSYVTRSAQKTSLRDKVEDMLNSKLDEDREDIPYGVLIKILEVLSKSEVDTALPILKIIEAATKQPEAPLNPQLPGGHEGMPAPYTAEEYSQAKKLLQAIVDLKETEFNDKE